MAMSTEARLECAHCQLGVSIARHAALVDVG